MFWLKKREVIHARGAWMIQNGYYDMYMGVCKGQLVQLKNPSACFRFADQPSAELFIYWLIERGEIKKGSDWRISYKMVRRQK